MQSSSSTGFGTSAQASKAPLAGSVGVGDAESTLGGNSSSAMGAATSMSSPSSSSTYEHHEDRLFRSWRTVAHYVVLAMNKAEKACSATAASVTSPTASNMPSSQPSSLASSASPSAEERKNAVREVDKVVVEFLRARIEWVRLVSTLEAKLQGKAEEMENIQQYVRCQPMLGVRRKRKRNCGTLPSTSILNSTPSTATAVTSTNVTISPVSTTTTSAAGLGTPFGDI